jgi:uncharacterized protein YbjT (DUF2867 family)
MSDSNQGRLAILGASGKLAYATLTSLLSHKLLPASSIIATTSATSESAPQWQKLAATGVTVRHATFDSPSSIEKALQDADRLFLVSSPRIDRDFHTAPSTSNGREGDHIVAIEAAIKVGVKHVFYTSLAFGRPSKAGVMRAHIETEKYLESQDKIKWTVIREGLYSESWPLYLGHWKLGEDDRSTVEIAGDGKIAWTAIGDLGLANAKVVAAEGDGYVGKTFYLSNTQEPRTMVEVAELVGRHLGRDINVQVVETPQHEELYTKQRSMDEGLIKWWVSTYAALKDGECDIKDDTLEKLLAEQGQQPTPFEDTVATMLGAK